MTEIAKAKRFAMAFAIWASVAVASGLVPEICPAANATEQQSALARQHVSRAPSRALDHSGRPRIGKASFYAKKFAGRKMANGRLMNPHGDNAASRTLPLGTTARVTNLKTGQSAVVNIEDRGPYVKGRIIDLSPSTARKIGIDREEGIGMVEVAPLTIPVPNGSLKAGAAAREMKADQRPIAQGG
ncbi:septal ring lytic transglycosylase RlpA family protein [Dechloromonas sp. A34]|uniref:septal ring lytic transglycosylase RlpA family protein n=1 Tax=Dechloromonas sp. A34 TaxID=447588 RepID=UPI00224969F8|nr:septal ring lytic transglycosylase RlpA family protein [Dechloromonas sp. A34]